jgi:carbonic anhydrase
MKKITVYSFAALFLVGGVIEAAPLLRGLEDLVKIYRKRQDDATPVSVLAWLKEGNSRFVAGKSNHGGYREDARERIQISASGQRPLAAVLSCIDSRTSPELIFDVSVGDLFTARVGANVVNDDVLGSLEVAVASGAKAVVVLGHTQCGGVMAACNGVELGHLTQLLAKIRPAIEAVHSHMNQDAVYAKEVGERVTTNRRYVSEVSHANARQSMRQILDRSSFLRQKVEAGEIQIKTALFDVFTGAVTFDP